MWRSGRRLWPTQSITFYYAARLIAPDADWRWLRSLKSRLAARAQPEDRFDRLVPPWQTLDSVSSSWTRRSPAYLPQAARAAISRWAAYGLLSLWLIRRRSIAVLTVSRHLEFDACGVNILLYPEDTKAKRAESFRLPEPILPISLALSKGDPPSPPRSHEHDGLWASYRGRPLIAGRIYDIVRARVFAKFGKTMGLHDFRRAGATFIAMDAPDKSALFQACCSMCRRISDNGFIISPDRCEASRRFAVHLAKIRNRLRPVSLRSEG